ncbi:MFS transporter [Thaumasiovibrio subtropicus]|uniref:MFS transporter n=1 Tax=Thaumasiovibrio subtropicus TaxID=1891207 RepID=UPI000B34D489|nr:MFS transporter [Thaumasiovibrio subtropicus]
MPNVYRALFEHPGSALFSFTGFIARLPISMTSIGIITMLSQLGRPYWLAGSVAATFILSTALLAPQVSRVVDKHGQSQVLPWATLISATSILLLLLCTHYGLPDWTLFVFALLGGCMPNMAALVRARWTAIYRHSPKLHTAYSFESVIDEICFIVGPPISVGLSVALFPQAGPLISVVFLIIGVSFFVMQKSTEPAVTLAARGTQQSALRSVPVRILVLSLISLGTIVGAVDIISVAFAEQEGNPASASLVLSIYAIGSCLSGLAFGTLRIKSPLQQQFMLAAFFTALTTLPLLFISSVWALSVAVFFSGLFFAPTMIIAMGLVERQVPESQLTEGLTWMNTGLGVGAGLGAAIAGWIVNDFGITSSFYLTLIAGSAVFALSSLLAQKLNKDAKHEVYCS